MFLPIPIISDINIIRNKRQNIINKDALHENSHRKQHDFAVNEQIMITKPNTDALHAKNIGPITIDQIFTNGTIAYWKTPHLKERINIPHIAILSFLNLSLSQTALGFLPVNSCQKNSVALPVTDSAFRDLNSQKESSRVSKYYISDRIQRIKSALSNSKDGNAEEKFPRHLIDSLDLTQIIEEVARHTATRRGYDALLSTVQRKPARLERNSDRLSLLSNRQRERYGVGQLGSSSIAPIARSFQGVQSEYALVEEATLLLSSRNNTAIDGDDASYSRLSYPPLYGEYSDPYDIDTIPQTDDDEWLYLAPEEYTAENILQAEQVIKSLLQIREWSRQEAIQTWAPTLAQMGATIDEDENILPEIYQDIVGKVKIIRVKSISDPSGKSSYSVRVKEDEFPILRLLREKEQKLVQNGGKELDKALVAIRDEIEVTTIQIISSLAQKVVSASKSLDHGLQIAARLDVIMAKAAYALSLNGVVPLVKTQGQISIENFLHPVLLRSMVDTDRVVPIDLRLSSDSGERALVISGPNGGGKTLSMKSFGLVSILTKLGIPIPVKEGSERPRIDYFDEIFVVVGDQQSVLDGESTWTSILNSCASMIQAIDEQQNEGNRPSHLVLLDELGTGTDPESGGAVAQAVLEELIAKSCRVVVTTHLPRLKALSYNDDNIGCAAVLLDYSDQSTFRRPSFNLEYGLIGESHALGAASRCVPSLPESVLSRASDLLDDIDEDEKDGTHKSYIQALTRSMEEQLERSRAATMSLENDASDSTQCRQAMVSLARSYECHLDRRLESLESAFQKLKSKELSEYELVGETLSELKIVRKKIISQEEQLAAKGLQVLPLNYVLSPGESVVIISQGEWEGMTAKVVSDGSNGDSSLGPNQVLVQPSFSLHAWDDVVLTNIDPMADRALILQRQDIAIWYADSIYDDTAYQSKPATSISNSKQRINSLFSTLDSVSKNNNTNKAASKKQAGKGAGKNFKSSRQRKAANKAKKR
eukprot:jgi/Psemu1/69549/estExt_Genemark1.C_9080019